MYDQLSAAFSFQMPAWNVRLERLDWPKGRLRACQLLAYASWVLLFEHDMTAKYRDRLSRIVQSRWIHCHPSERVIGDALIETPGGCKVPSEKV